MALTPLLPPPYNRYGTALPPNPAARRQPWNPAMGGSYCALFPQTQLFGQSDAFSAPEWVQFIYWVNANWAWDRAPWPPSLQQYDDALDTAAAWGVVDPQLCPVMKQQLWEEYTSQLVGWPQGMSWNKNYLGWGGWDRGSTQSLPDMLLMQMGMGGNGGSIGKGGWGLNSYWALERLPRSIRRQIGYQSPWS